MSPSIGNGSAKAVIGVGNRFRGDDAAGLLVAELLRSRVPDGILVRESSGNPADLLDWFELADDVLVVDAAITGAEPGTVTRFDATAGPIESSVLRGSTHLVSVSDTIELARATGRLPARLTVIAIEGASFSAGTEPSPEVEAAGVRVAEELLADLEDDSDA